MMAGFGFRVPRFGRGFKKGSDSSLLILLFETQAVAGNALRWLALRADSESRGHVSAQAIRS